MMKKIIYYSSSSFFYALYVAALRSGGLSKHQPPGLQQLQSLLKDSPITPGEGIVYNLGYGAHGEQCLALWSKGDGDMVQRMVVSFLDLSSASNYHLIEINVPGQFWLNIGAGLLKVRFLNRWGYWLVQQGLLKVKQQLIAMADLSPDEA